MGRPVRSDCTVETFEKTKPSEQFGKKEQKRKKAKSPCVDSFANYFTKTSVLTF